MKSFSSFLVEAEQTGVEPPKRVSNDLVTIFGRNNPPHRGHGMVLDHASKIADSIGDNDKADQRFYTSRSQDPKKNPLPYEVKLDHLKRMFPQHAQKWDDDSNVRTIMNAAQKAHGEGYKNFHFVGGGDRRQGMEDLMRKYNGNLYNFDNIYSHSAGDREEQNPEMINKLGADGRRPIEQISASMMRKAAQNGNLDEFIEGLNIDKKGYTMEDARELFNSLRQYMGKNEEWEVNPRGNKQLIGELYRGGQLYNEGDWVESLTSGLVGEVRRCGANHLICVTENGVMFKNFIYEVQSI